MSGPDPTTPIEPGLTGPLVITPVAIPGAGTLGLTHCPGRHHVDGAGRRWRRELSRDLTAVQHWNADAIITLIEDHEFSVLGVPDLLFASLIFSLTANALLGSKNLPDLFVVFLKSFQLFANAFAAVLAL